MIKKIGLVLVVGIAALLFLGWDHLPHDLSAGVDLSTTRGAVAPPPEGDRKLFVCFGFADLEQGVVSLHPAQGGRVTEVLVRENDEVPAGAVLLRLDARAARFRLAEARGILDKALAERAKAEKAPEQHRSRIAQQEAALQAARCRVSGARHTLAARKAQQRVESIGRSRGDPVLVEEIAAAEERVHEFEEAESLEVKKLKALQLRDPSVDVNLAEADVATMRARLQQAEQVLEEHTLRAPEAGRVLRIFTSPGEMLSPQPRQMAVQFCPARPRLIRAEVEQVFAQRVEVGQPALVEDDGRSGIVWRGHVKRIADWYTKRRLIAEEQIQLKDVRTLECLIALDEGQPPLRIGQRVRVTISQAPPAEKAAKGGAGKPGKK